MSFMADNKKLPKYEESQLEGTGTFSELLQFKHPTPTQSVDLLPGTPIVLEVMSYTVVKGEQDFQPFERINLLQDGKPVAVGQVTTYSHNRISDITEINFLIVALALEDGELVCLSAKEVTKDFIETTEATFLLTGDPHDEEYDG